MFIHSVFCVYLLFTTAFKTLYFNCQSCIIVRCLYLFFSFWQFCLLLTEIVNVAILGLVHFNKSLNNKNEVKLNFNIFLVSNTTFSNDNKPDIHKNVLV